MLLKTQIKLEETVGKNISSIKYDDDRLLICYTDNTFVFFGRYQNYDYSEQGDFNITFEKFIEKINIRPDGSTWFTRTQEMFIDSGIISEETLLEACADKIKSRIEATEKIEKEEFERLKLKFS